MKNYILNKKNGFTLIEIIITLTMVAILGAMMFSYFGTSLLQSSMPIIRLEAAMRLNQALEKITARYNLYPNWRPNTVYAVGDAVIPSLPNVNGYTYDCTTAGTSAAAEPGWPIAANGTVTNGTVVWTRSNVIPPTLAVLKAAIGAEGTNQTTTVFGAPAISYRVIQNRFITFNPLNQEVSIDGNPSHPDYGKYLKVTIGHRSDAANHTSETISTIFVRR